MINPYNVLIMDTITASTTSGFTLELDNTLEPRVPYNNQRFDNLLYSVSKSNKLDEKRLVHSNVEGDLFYVNYLTYLEKCWANHLTPVITPDIIWMTLLVELSTLVRENTEVVRDLFTTSKDKTEILVPAISGYVLPLQLVVDRLRDFVPSGVDTYIPEFSTTCPGARLAHYAAFCDMVSPYYSYGMMLCGFPRMVIRGTGEDYARMWSTWFKLPNLLRDLDKVWYDRVNDLLIEIGQAYCNQDAAFWSKIFSAKKCGSGHQTNVDGWFTQLYRKKPDGPRYAGNYPSTAAKVDYKLIDTNQTFSMIQGLFASKADDNNVMTPQWGTLVFETTKTQ